MMKKFLRGLFALSLCFVMFMMASCSNVSKSYADKINKEAQDDDDEYYTLDKVRKDLGDERVEIIFAKSGVIISVKGCKTLEDLKTKIENDEDVEGLIVTFVAGNAMSASYRKITADDLKGK